MSGNLYEILGISRGADSAEVRRAYLRMSKTAHPDKGGSEEEFKKVQQAYEILSDDDKRAFYDQTGQVPGEEGPGGGGGGGVPFPFDIGSMFGGIFGGGGMPFGMNMGGGGMGQQARGRGPKRPKGPPKIHEIGLTLSDYFFGKKVQLKFERQKFCDACRGEGAESFETCGTCRGSGFREQQIMIGPGMIATSRGPCNGCGGEGKKVKGVCTSCNGLKFKSQEKVLVATIEAGMRAGDILKFPKECSDQHEFEEPGDVHIVLRDAEEYAGPHSISRSGDDLKAVLKVPFLTALLGGKEVLQGHPAHPEGLTIQIPVGSMRGDVISVAGEGMPIKGAAPRRFGVLYVTIAVDVGVTEKEKLEAHKDSIRGFFD